MVEGMTFGGLPFPGTVVLNRILVMNIILNEMIDVWDAVRIFNYLLKMFLSTDMFFEQRFRNFTKNLLYIKFTYYSKDNQQEYSRLGKWFSLQCLEPWMHRGGRITAILG